MPRVTEWEAEEESHAWRRYYWRPSRKGNLTRLLPDGRRLTVFPSAYHSGRWARSISAGTQVQVHYSRGTYASEDEAVYAVWEAAWGDEPCTS
jgi:hypothetical protein